MAREKVGGAPGAGHMDETTQIDGSHSAEEPSNPMNPSPSQDPTASSSDPAPTASTEATPGGAGGARKRVARKPAAKRAAAADATPEAPGKPAARKAAPRKDAAKKAAPAKRSAAKAPAKRAATTPAAPETAAGPAASERAAAEATTAEAATTERAGAEQAPAERATGQSASAEKVSGEPGGATTATRRAAGRKAAANSGGKPPAKPPRRTSAELSATSKQAAEARATMQRQHRRIEFWRAAALGAETAGVVGMVVAGFLPWEWDDPLWGRTEGPAVAAQAAVAVTVLAVLAAWVLRADPWRAAARTVAVPAALLAAALGVASVWQADPGARGFGGPVLAVAGVLATAGTIGWLITGRRLRALFAFGVGYARTGGYGNLPAVRRAQLLGAPAGAVGVAAVVTGALLVTPGLVSTEDTSTAERLVLSGVTPTGLTEPSWEIELPAGATNTTVRATPGGLAVDEEHGIRMVDPADGQTRWHWRDEAYLRAAVALAEEGTTLVMALTYDGDLAGRDRLVALDTTTGEVRWDQFDDNLVATMASLGVAPVDGAWLAMPERVQPSPEAQTDPSAPDQPLGVQLIDVATGEPQWSDSGAEGCTLSAIGAGSPDIVMITEDCAVPEGVGSGAGECRVSALSVADGQRLWTWPPTERIDPAEAYPAGCRMTALEDRVFLTYQLTANEFDPGAPVVQTPALLLDPRTGEEIWAAEREDDSYAPLGVDGLTNPAAVVGDHVVGIEWPSGQQGVGTAVLIVRSMADGSRLGEVALPEGQPVAVRAANDDTVMMSHYSVENDQVLLLEVDLPTLTVAGETPVASGSESRQFRSAGLAVGPGTVAVDTLVIPGADAGPADARLLVHGFG